MQKFSPKLSIFLKNADKKCSFFSEIGYTFKQKSIDIYQNMLLLIGARIYVVAYLPDRDLAGSCRLTSGSAMAEKREIS